MILFFLLPSFGYAEKIPPHMAAMAAQLYKGVEGDLKRKKLTPARRKALEESNKTLRDMGVHRWSTKPAKIGGALPEVAEKLKLDLAKEQDREMLREFISKRTDKGTEEALRSFEKKVKRPISQEERNKKSVEIDGAISAAQEKLKKIYTGTPVDGRAVQMKWKPDTGKFFMKVSDDGSGDSEEFATTFSGDVHSEISENGKDMTLGVKPSDSPLRAITEEDIKTLRGNILGEWTDKETGEIYVFSATNQEIGEILAPREVFDEKIEQIRDKIKSVEKTKIFKWQNPVTGKVVKQEKYRRLKEPFEFLGKEYALDNAKEEMARLNKEIEELKVERDGGKLPPVNQYDPAGFGDIKDTKGAGPITVHVTRPDVGYSYTYDEAIFDGRRISAKRTYRDVKDIDPKIPERIRNQLINNSWNPPGWLDLEASIDVETGDMVLEGSKWALHVTYSGFFGSPPDVDRIHSPHPWSRVLRKGGTVFDVAEGAADSFVP